MRGTLRSRCYFSHLPTLATRPLLRLYKLQGVALLSLLSTLTWAQQAATGNASPLPTTTREGLVIEEVIVTVSKREESLQDVLGSVSAFSGDTLQRNNVQDFNSLVELVPGMVAQDKDQIAIRGISRTRDGPSPVAFHVNDVFIAMRGEPFYDLAAVEILRGPSGTLFGRNATAGAINAKWQRPVPELEAGGTLRYSELEEQQIQFYANAPVFGEGDARMLVRIAGMQRRIGGTVDNLLRDSEDDGASVRDQFLRIYVTSELDENLDLSLRAVRYENQPDGVNILFSPSLATRRGGTFEELGARPLPDDVTKVRSTVDERYGNTFENFTRVDGDLTWALSQMPLLGDLDVVLVGGMLTRKANDVYDLDGTEVPITEGRSRFRDDIRRTAELRLVSANDNGFDWLAGLFWYRQTFDRDIVVDVRNFVSPSTFGLPLPGPEIQVDIEAKMSGQRLLDHSKAAFLNLDLDLAQVFGWAPIQITAGVRRNYDEFSLKTARSQITIAEPLTGTPIPFIDSANIRQEADFAETTGELGARWFYSEEGMLYAELSRGYKPGLAQLVQLADGSTIENDVAPEFLNAVELGWKTAFMQNTLKLSAAAFVYDYQDLQVSQIVPGGVVTENAASATINGAELELQWAPDGAFYLQGTVAWTDATYDEYCGTDPALGESMTEPGCTEDAPLDFSGETMTAAPEFSAALLASYTWQLGEYGSLTPAVKVSWTDELDRRGLGNPNDVIEAHSTSDIRLAWESPAQRWKAELFVENVEGNDDIFFSTFTPLGGRPNTYTLINNIPPRLAGISLELRL
jgi:iron complex outermembrane receptor protein